MLLFYVGHCGGLKADTNEDKEQTLSLVTENCQDITKQILRYQIIRAQMRVVNLPFIQTKASLPMQVLLIHKIKPPTQLPLCTNYYSAIVRKKYFS